MALIQGDCLFKIHSAPLGGFFHIPLFRDYMYLKSWLPEGFWQILQAQRD